jgi:polyhydroxybutyrate depolymerase
MWKPYRLFATVVVLFIVYAIPLGGQPAKKDTFVELKYTVGQINDTEIEYDGLKRRYLYYIPKNFNPKATHPLIFILHGFNQPVETIISGYSAMQAEADADGTILIYPVATGSFEKRSLAWNTHYGTFANTAFPETEKVDDVGFISHLIDMFLDNMNVDPDGVYVTGTSLGGAMTYALSCYIPERLAAIAPVIMQVSTKIVDEFQKAKPLPVMIITGTADPLVSATGNKGAEKDMLSIVSTEANIAYWKVRNEISSDPVETALVDKVTEVFKGVQTPSHIIRYSWKSATGNDIVWLKVVNGGHWLPTYADGKALDASNLNGFDGSDMGNLNCDYMASEGIYEFLLSHKRRKQSCLAKYEIKLG